MNCTPLLFPWINTVSAKPSLKAEVLFLSIRCTEVSAKGQQALLSGRRLLTRKASMVDTSLSFHQCASAGGLAISVGTAKICLA